MGQVKKPNVKYDNYEAGVSYDDGTMNTKDFLIGALVGGLVGAATALFMAPKSGKELREDFNSQAETLKERASGWTEMAKEKGTNIAAVAKDKTSTLSQSVQEQSGTLMDKVKTAMPTGSGSNSTTDNGGSATGVMEQAKEAANTVKDTVSQKLEETKKAFDQTEKSFGGANESSNSSQTSSTANKSGEGSKSDSAVYANPADAGVNEKTQGGGANATSNPVKANNNSSNSNSSKPNNKKNNK